jgi:hypothetical protein
MPHFKGQKTGLTGVNSVDAPPLAKNWGRVNECQLANSGLRFTDQGSLITSFLQPESFQAPRKKYRWEEGKEKKMYRSVL